MVWGLKFQEKLRPLQGFETYGLVKVMGDPPYEGPGPNQLYSKTAWEPTPMESSLTGQLEL